MQRRSFLVYMGLAYVIFTWSLNVVLVKRVIGHIDPLAFTGMRFLAMAPLAVALAYVRKEPLRVDLRDLPLLLLCGACGYGVYQYLWVIGLAHTTPFASALLGSTTPIITLTIVAGLGHERVRSGRWLAALVAFVGVAIFEGAFSGNFMVRIGDVLTFMAAAVFAIYNVASARLLARYSPLSLLALTIVLGTAIILPGAVPRMLHMRLSDFSLADWAIYAYAVLFPIVLTYPVWSYGITQLGAGRTSLFQFALPIVTGVLSIALLRTPIAGYQVAGAAVCIGGMALAQILGRVS
ncbi:MAG: DMT family transporter, partial [Candidatus Eremiobacteraeota bacterium]|nr:DMT family transporter [Candidatus Eremiobacteraeota bacterium]